MSSDNAQVEVLEQLQSHFEDIAWFIGKYDEDKDVYSRLEWTRKILGRMHPDELEALTISIGETFEKYSSCAESIKNAMAPSELDHIDYKPVKSEWSEYREINLPTWVIVQLPRITKDQSNDGYTRNETVSTVMREFFAFLLGKTSRVNFSFASKPEPFSLAPLYYQEGGLATSWINSAIQLHTVDFSRLKGEFELNLSRYIATIVTLIRIELLEPKQIPIKHGRKAKEDKGN